MAKKVINIYKARFQIEEGFRDIKNSRFGFGFSESLSYKQERLEILLLVAMLAYLAMMIMGKTAKQCNLERDFQANTTRNRTVLSLFYLGCQVLRERQIEFNNDELQSGLKALVLMIKFYEST